MISISTHYLPSISLSTNIVPWETSYLLFGVMSEY